MKRCARSTPTAPGCVVWTVWHPGSVETQRVAAAMTVNERIFMADPSKDGKTGKKRSGPGRGRYPLLRPSSLFPLDGPLLNAAASPRVPRGVYFLLFTVSGFARLVYESISSHYLKLFLGA